MLSYSILSCLTLCYLFYSMQLYLILSSSFVFYHALSYSIMLYLILSYLSYSVTFYPIPSYSIPFHPNLFYSISFHLILFYSILVYPILSYSILSHHILSYSVLLYPPQSSPLLSAHLTCAGTDDLGPEVGIHRGGDSHCISPFIKHTQMRCTVVYAKRVKIQVVSQK